MQLDTASGDTPEARLASLGLTLPDAPPAFAAYEPATMANGVLYLSAQLPMRNGALAYSGRIGGELSAEDGYAACQLCALNALAQIHKALGGFEQLRGLLRIEGILNVAPGFSQMPAVLNGASHLFNAVLGERGKHARVISSNPVTPLDAPCMVHLMAQVR